MNLMDTIAYGDHAVQLANTAAGATYSLRDTFADDILDEAGTCGEAHEVAPVASTQLYSP